VCDPAISKAKTNKSFSDEDWQEMYQQQLKIRAEYNITAAALLRSMDMPECLIPYLNNNECIPTEKIKIVWGSRLRKSLKEKSFCGIANSTKDYLFEFYYANLAAFKEKEIRRVYIRSENKIGVVSHKHLEKQTVIDLFKDFKPANVDVEELLKHIDIDVTYYLSHFDAPIVVQSSACSGYGTITAVSDSSFGLIGITSRHVLVNDYFDLDSLQEEEEVVVDGYEARCPVTRRSLAESHVPIGYFTKNSINKYDDIAIVHFFDNNTFNINSININIPSCRFHDKPYEIYDIILRKGKVIKAGISTLTTRGVITSVDSFFDFKVRPTECSVFSTLGDSGSLIISDEDDTRGIVLGVLSKGGNLVSTFCVSIFSLYFISELKFDAED
jgi:hypothetical protein